MTIAFELWQFVGGVLLIVGAVWRLSAVLRDRTEALILDKRVTILEKDLKSHIDIVQMQFAQFVNTQREIGISTTERHRENRATLAEIESDVKSLSSKFDTFVNRFVKIG